MQTQWAVEVGHQLSSVVVDDLSRTQIAQYAGASGDFTPLHTDEIYATQVAGFPTVFAHGMLTMALTGRVVTDNFGIQSLRRFGGRFVDKVWPGDTLTVTAIVTSVVVDGDHQTRTLALTTTNQDGVEVFRGEATLQSPTAP
jgi:acyl dehydratase